MILQSLYELYDRLKDAPDYKIAPPGYSLQKITFKVVVSLEGKLFEIQDARVASGGRLRPQQIMVPGGAKKSGKGLNPGFLWDNTAYMLGFKADDSDPDRTARSFESFREKHLGLEIGSAAFSVVRRFLETWNPEAASAHSILTEIGTGFGLFQVLGETSYVHQAPEVEAWWERHASEGEARGSGRCLITGDLERIAATHPKVKGVAGAQPSGAAIVSFNESAYESYGKSQSLNAPVSEAAAFRYTTGLNALLDGPQSHKHRLSIGDTTVVFWTARPSPTEDIFARFAAKGSAALEGEEVQDEAMRQKLEAFLSALRQGRKAYAELEEDPEKTHFFLLGLSPNAARISVRFFYRATLSELLENLRRHYDDIRIRPRPASGRRRADPEFPPAWILLRQTARESKEIPPILAGPFLRAIVAGARYPAGLYSAVVRRIHADRTVNYARACVIKGFLTRNLGKDVCMSLDTERTDPGYRVGRLFAALEKTQKDALGEKLSATIRDRFYSSASATPRTVFPRLLRTYQHHLAKLQGGQKINREKLVQEILGPLQDFPAHLDLAGQGLFALGYYQQMQGFYTRRQEQTTES
jgi:CRISPR-associated protein Csd1